MTLQAFFCIMAKNNRRIIIFTEAYLKVAVIGTGYVGLVTGACLADLNHEVVCVDLEKDKIARLNRGEIPIFEQGLEELVKRNLAANRLSFTTDLGSAVRVSQVVFITVGTPSTEEGEADLTFLKDAASQIADAINSFKVIVNKSTVPVGSTRLVQRIIEERIDHQQEFEVVSNPEFLREGSAVNDFSSPDRIVIGAEGQRAIGVLTELYRSLNAPLVVTDPASAEMIKYASNAFLACKVSFINAIANICEAVGADVREVALGMGYDKRIGFEFLRPGPGFGGSCFPKDCRALVDIASKAGYNFYLLAGVLEVNREQMKLMVEKVRERLGSLEGARIGIWGLTFKANTDDLRESPAMHICALLEKEGASITAYDPVGMEGARPLLPGITFAGNPYEAAAEADLLLLLTDWDEFKWVDFRRLKDLLKKPVIIDTRNCLDPLTLRRLGFEYEGVGR
jgi:UDPglucose 6-dehydrogenase